MKNFFESLFSAVIWLFGLIMFVIGGIGAVIERPIDLDFLLFSLMGLGLMHDISNPSSPSKILKRHQLFMQLRKKIDNAEFISFNETIDFIDKIYNYQPSEFSNGLGEDKLINPAGVNQGSCKIFAFAQMHHLTPKQTLNLFGDYYHVDVLQNPDATDHQNIRNFIKYGWEGISFKNQAVLKSRI